MITSILVSEIIDFAQEHGGEFYKNLDRKTLYEYAKKHIEFKTIIIVRDKEGIVAVCRWNMVEDDTAFIIDLIIKPEHRGRELIKQILAKGLTMFPSTKYLIWERKAKYPNREQKKYLIEDILKRRD